MSSSNLAVRMEHTATDLLSHPPRPVLRVVANDEHPVQSGPPHFFHEQEVRHTRSGSALLPRSLIR